MSELLFLFFPAFFTLRIHLTPALHTFFAASSS